MEDWNNDVRVTVPSAASEFLTALRFECLQEPNSIAQEIYDELDETEDGEVTPKEYCEVARKHTARLTDDQCKEIIKLMDEGNFPFSTCSNKQFVQWCANEKVESDFDADWQLRVITTEFSPSPNSRQPT